MAEKVAVANELAFGVGQYINNIVTLTKLFIRGIAQNHIWRLSSQELQKWIDTAII